MNKRLFKALAELKATQELLKIEREEDLEQYRQKIHNRPIEERRDEGYTWYPLNVLRMGYTYGDRAYVTVERTNRLNQPHHFRAGNTISFFTKQAGVHKAERHGVVKYVNKNKMQLVLNTRDLPDWMGVGMLGVDLLFDERTYLEMDRAIDKVQKAKQDRLAQLRDVMMGLDVPTFRPPKHTFVLPQLNDSQNAAVQQILSSQEVSIIHGPPGTGKTTTLIQAIKLLCKTENTVLVTAPSNTAVDLLTERLADEGLNVVRIGNISRVDEKIISHTLEQIVAKHPETKNIKKVRMQAADLRRKIGRKGGKVSRKEWQERHQLKKEMYELSSWANQLESRLTQQVLDNAEVIACTLVNATHPTIVKHKFKTVVVDEAAQALEPATWIPILRASRVVLAGDPFQLPPTVKSKEAQKGGFEVTLIEKCLKTIPDNVAYLDTQYRMNDAIMGFSNQEFYEGRLKSDLTVGYQQLQIEQKEPLEFIDTAGCGFEEVLDEKTKSRYNKEEFMILCEHLYQLLDSFKTKEIELPSITIISPYNQQVRLMRESIAEDPILSEIPLKVSSIDGFQGQESEIVYISLVRSNTKGEIGFLKDYRRMNVALTRAKKKLVVIGNSATIGANAFYERFLIYCEKHGYYRTAWEFMQ